MWVLAADSPFVVWGTVASAVIVCFTFVYALTQIGPAKKAAKTAEEHANAARIEADAARIEADAALMQVSTTKQRLDTERRKLDHDREAFSISIRPLIVDTPLRKPTSDLKVSEIMERWASPTAPPEERNFYQFNDNNMTADVLEMEVKNIGGMPAFVHSAQLVANADVVKEGFASLNRKVIPQHETARFKQHISSSKPRQAFRTAVRDGTASLEIKYSDLSGHQRLLSRIAFTGDQDKTLRVTKIELFLCDEGWNAEPSPFATTDPNRGHRAS